MKPDSTCSLRTFQIPKVCKMRWVHGTGENRAGGVGIIVGRVLDPWWRRREWRRFWRSALT